MTQKFVDPLVNWIFARYGGSVRLARSRSLHTPPGGLYPWWKLAGRYYLQRLLPHNREIWNSLDRPLPGRRNLWHYDEDIRSRPLYANHIDADVLIICIRTHQRMLLPTERAPLSHAIAP